MAAIRPVVLVFEEFATPTVTVTTPDLNCLIVGPAYYIQDYFQPGTTNYADKANIQIGSNYGTLENSPAGATPVGTDVITVAEPPNNLPGALLDGASVEIFFDQARVIITSGVLGTTTSGSNAFTVTDAVDFTTGTTKVLPGDRIGVYDGTHFIWMTVYTVDSATELHFTQDVPSSGFTPGSGQTWRVERQINDAEIATSFFTTQNNTIDINGSVTLNVPTQGAKVVSFAKVYIQYRSLRQDLQQVGIVESENDILTMIGRIDGRDPLAVGAFIALQNTTTQIQFYGVKSNDLQGHTSCRDAIAADSTIYAIVPLLADIPTIEMWNVDCNGLAQPDESTGRAQRFRVVIGSGTLPLIATLVTPAATAKTVQLTSSAPAINTDLTIPGIDLIGGGVVPGDHVKITVDAAGVSRIGDYLVAHVLSATHLEVDPSTPIPGSTQTANATLEVRAANDVTVKIASTPYTGVASGATDDLYLILQDPNGTFVSSGVLPGDIITMPGDPTTANFATNTSKFVVASVLSEQRLEIVNNGQDTATVQNELPHGRSWVTGTNVPTSNTLNYEVTRSLTKDQQVTALVAVAQSFNSSRTVLVWPDLCDVAGVVNAKAQPGYYLSCAVGGMTAGLPPHQGFTFLGIAGIAQIYDSNTYFTDRQLTNLSNGGWYVFAQQTPQALPFTIHQLTTDVQTLESGEFSIVKNFDFVALFFVDILQGFLGIYNVTPEALLFLRAALTTGGTTLLQQTFARIGSPLTSFQINDLTISPVSRDRVVTHLGVGLPAPLNVVELHLVG